MRIAWHRKATEITKRMIEGKNVTLEPVAKDDYGRLVANVYQDGKSVRARLKRISIC
jgi:endonuclease YncB( thermonuclease family)